MILCFFIPPINFSQTIVSWNEINGLNYFRAIIFLIGSTYLPGSSLFKILLPNKSIYNIFKIEPILLKLLFYPLLSFIFLGFTTALLDVLGIKKGFFNISIFILIFVLIILELLTQRKLTNNLKRKALRRKLSKYSILILLFTIGVVVISLGIHLSSKYLIPGDRWRGVSYAYFIGNGNLNDKFECAKYPLFWGYISFGLSSLSGIPYINTNAMLFPFVYLVILSIYLFTKALLNNKKEFYPVLSTFLIFFFSEFSNMFNSQFLQAGTMFTLIGIFQFSYHSFAFSSLFLALTFILRLIEEKSNSINKKERFKLIFLSSLLFLHSHILYMPLTIAGIIFITFYILNYKKKNLGIILIFLILSILLFIFYDIILTFFLSWILINRLDYFFGIVISHIEFYTILIILFLILILSYRIFTRKGQKNKELKKYSRKKNLFIKLMFILFLTIFSEFLFFNYCCNIFQNFFGFYNKLLYINFGFIGTIGIFLSYYTFKENRKLFYICLLWIIFTIIISSVLIFKFWIMFPKENPNEFSDWGYYIMMYWFTRNWYFIIIPLSIFSAIGLIKSQPAPNS